jgi:hypothetical protein
MCDPPHCPPEDSYAVTCNNNFLQPMAAFAQVVDGPEDPIPLFFNSNSCSGAYIPDRENASDGASPLSVFECTSSLLHVMDESLYNDFVAQDMSLPSEVVNILKGGLTDCGSGSTTANSFGDPGFNCVLGFYVPPNYRIIFFKENPSKTPPGTILEPLEYGPGTLITNTCCQQIQWGPSKNSFLKDKNGQPLRVDQCCTKAFPADAAHTAPYLIVLRREMLHDMILDACVKQRQITIGPYSLNQVWKPQTSGCDDFMTAFCTQPLLNTDSSQEACQCFWQQAALDRIYGASVKLPVICFGTDEDHPGDISRNCAFNPKAYKTFAMQQNGCSFAQCEQTIRQSSINNKIQCDGSFVQSSLPARAEVNVSVTVSPTDDVIYDRTVVSTMPEWIWAIFGTGVSMVLVFFVCLTFVA